MLRNIALIEKAAMLDAKDAKEALESGNVTEYVSKAGINPEDMLYSFAFSSSLPKLIKHGIIKSPKDLDAEKEGSAGRMLLEGTLAAGDTFHELAVSLAQQGC